MQTIKCVVVGDGAVGKVKTNLTVTPVTHADKVHRSTDLFADILHDQQISFRVCPHST